jgi:hypothetical protein
VTETVEVTSEAEAEAGAGAGEAEGCNGTAAALREETGSFTGRRGAAAAAGWGGSSECALGCVSTCGAWSTVADLALEVRGAAGAAEEAAGCCREEEHCAETAKDDEEEEEIVRPATPLATASATAAETLLPAVGSGRVCRGCYHAKNSTAFRCKLPLQAG